MENNKESGSNNNNTQPWIAVCPPFATGSCAVERTVVRVCGVGSLKVTLRGTREHHFTFNAICFIIHSFSIFIVTTTGPL